SILHSIFHSLGPNGAPEYHALNTDDDKENYVRRYRKNVFADPRYSIDVTRQELYDHNDQEIRNLLTNPDVFLDPALYYRFLEELFDVNIYIFSSPRGNEESFAMLETPRNKMFHTRRLTNRKGTIIIFKHWGSEFDKLTFPQCELIVIYDTVNKKIDTALFEMEMSEILHDVIINTKNTISWSIDPNNVRLIPRKNLYNTLNSYQILQTGGTLIGQILDGYGKARAFILKLPPVETERNNAPSDSSVGRNNAPSEVTVMIPPAQPENLPIYGTPVISDLSTVYRALGNQIMRVSLNPKGLVDGVWYQVLDLEEGFYVPIKPIERSHLPDIPEGSDNPLFSDGKNMVRRLRELTRINKIIMQIIQWLFLQFNGNLIDFIEKYFLIDPRRIVNSEKYYNISKVRRRLPNIKSMSDALNYVSQIIPTLVQNDKIIIYSKKYAEGIIYFLKEYIKSSDYILGPADPPKYLKVILEEESDYKQFGNTVIFIREVDMRAWLFTKTRLGIKTSSIYRHIDFSDNLVSEPIIYQDPAGRNYLIQNVINSEYLRAINVAYEWYTSKINYGFETGEYPKSSQIPHHVI
ncbi:MAG TPA: hypothetical protein VKR58_04895, partial [Aquella sp.]|nr:hypothetical protein [Aquella sp.]